MKNKIMTSIKLKLVKPVIAAIKLTNLDMMLAARDYVIQEKSDGYHEYLELRQEFSFG